MRAQLLAILLAITVILLAALVYFSLPAMMPAQLGLPQAVPSPSEISQTTTPGAIATLSAQQVEELWLTINNPNVQRVCLQKAKEAAGGYSWAVQSCTCEETALADEKNYECTVHALDSDHFLRVHCVKSARQCQVNSERGITVLTFEQVAEIAQSS